MKSVIILKLFSTIYALINRVYMVILQPARVMQDVIFRKFVLRAHILCIKSE